MALLLAVITATLVGCFSREATSTVHVEEIVHVALLHDARRRQP